MNSTSMITMYFSMLVYYIPTLIVCMAAVVVIFMKWKQSSSASLLALLGFGLVLLMAIVVPVVQTALQYWIFHNPENSNLPGRAWMFSVVGIINGVMHAVSYLLLLAAVYSGRKTINAE